MKLDLDSSITLLQTQLLKLNLRVGSVPNRPYSALSDQYCTTIGEVDAHVAHRVHMHYDDVEPRSYEGDLVG